MTVDVLREKYAGYISVVETGKTKENGGSRDRVLKMGGQTAMPYLFGEGDMPNRPLMAMEILDCKPTDWPEGLVQALGAEADDPLAWGKKCVSEYKADALCVRLQSAHPDSGNAKVEDTTAFLKKLSAEVAVPLIILGSGDDEKDRALMPEVSHELKNENCLLGVATQENYKTLTASCLADNHAIIAESPIDINIAKQVNILITDMGFDKKRIVMHPTTASLGYGMEYVYSIMERARLAAFGGDWALAMPMILFVGQEAWRVKESKESTPVGVSWEIATAAAMLQSGVDLIVLRHPESAVQVKHFIEKDLKK
ncbi:MAG: acetyl-CoA decarbonylase/synthase complex subunit delta [Candidatus Omnitrophota bacterium]